MTTEKSGWVLKIVNTNIKKDKSLNRNKNRKLKKYLHLNIKQTYEEIEIILSNVRYQTRMYFEPSTLITCFVRDNRGSKNNKTIFGWILENKKAEILGLCYGHRNKGQKTVNKNMEIYKKALEK